LLQRAPYLDVHRCWYRLRLALLVELSGRHSRYAGVDGRGADELARSHVEKLVLALDPKVVARRAVLAPLLAGRERVFWGRRPLQVIKLVVEIWCCARHVDPRMGGLGLSTEYYRSY